jgi:hypothetical protein
MMRANQPYNFTAQGDVDMYGAKNVNSYGQGGQQHTNLNANSNATYGQGRNLQTNPNNTAQSFNITPTELQASNNRPPVVSDGGCCCSIM